MHKNSENISNYLTKFVKWFTIYRIVWYNIQENNGAVIIHKNNNFLER